MTMGTLLLNPPKYWKGQYVSREVILNWHYIWSFLLEMRRITTRQAKLFLSLATGMKEGWR